MPGLADFSFILHDLVVVRVCKFCAGGKFARRNLRDRILFDPIGNRNGFTPRSGKEFKEFDVGTNEGGRASRLESVTPVKIVHDEQPDESTAKLWVKKPGGAMWRRESRGGPPVCS